MFYVLHIIYLPDTKTLLYKPVNTRHIDVIFANFNQRVY